MEIEVQTLVLIDNSLSVSKVNREITRSTLKYLFSHTHEGRAYCFAPFSHTLDYAESYTIDYIGLEDMADRLEYENKEASITDVLTYVLDEWEKSDFACRDILIFTDGLEEESDYYEKEELFYMLENTSYPVYAVCLDQKDNKDAAKNLSAICRVSGGKIFHTEFEGSDAEVERQLTEQIMNSMEQYKRNNWDVYDKENEDENENAEENQNEEKNDEVLDETEEINQINFQDEFLLPDKETEVIYETEKTKTEFTPVSYAVLGSSLFLALCGVFLSWCIYIKHRRKVKEEEDEYREKILNIARQTQEDFKHAGRAKRMTENPLEEIECEKFNSMCETVTLFNRGEKIEDGGTRLLCEGKEKADVIFEDLADPSKYFRIPALSRIVLGRSSSTCDLAFDYDDSVSAKHCEMVLKGENYYIRDLESSNGTFVNNEKVYTEAELRDGDMLKMGSLSVLVRFT